MSVVIADLGGDRLAEAAGELKAIAGEEHVMAVETDVASRGIAGGARTRRASSVSAASTC